METSSLGRALVVEQARAPLMRYQGAETVANFGDSEREFLSALQGCVVIREDWRARMRVSGSDAARWLNGMLTNTAALEDGAGNYSFLLNPQGRIQGDCYLFRDGDDYILETSAGQRETIKTWLDHYIIMDDVALADEPELAASVAIIGPQAPTLLAALDPAFPGLQPLLTRAVRVGGRPVSVVVDDACRVPCFHLWHGPADSDVLWEAVVGQGATRTGADVAERLRIASGVPLFGVDIFNRDLAPETGQSRALHFNKGCYIGQEIVERIRSRGQVHRGLRGFIAEKEVAAGVEIMAADRAIGKITSVATLPLADGPVCAGLGIVRLQPVDEGAELRAGGVLVRAVRLPFAMAAQN